MILKRFRDHGIVKNDFHLIAIYGHMKTINVRSY